MSEWGQDSAESTWASKAAKAAEEGGSLGATLAAQAAAPPAAAPDAKQEPEELTLEAVRGQLDALRQRMNEIRSVTEAEILKNWTSPWKGADMVATKVDARLATHQEYRATMTRVRELGMLEAKLDPEHVDPATGTARGGHSAIGR
jgi:hypothetical protein